MKRTIKEYIPTAIALVLMLVVLLWFLDGKHKMSLLRNSHMFSSAKIVSCNFIAKQGGTINVNYTWVSPDGIQHSGNEGYTGIFSFNECEDYLLDKRFPVIYNPNDFNSYVMLIFPKDFAWYGHPYPDSLKWVLTVMKKNKK